MTVALTRAQAVARVKQGLGWRRDKADEILLELRIQQEELEKGQSLPRWLRTEGTITGTANVATANLPTGFIRWDDESDIFMADADGVLGVVSIVDHGDLILYGQDEETGEVLEGAALRLAVRATQVIVRPVPEKAWTLDAAWYFKDTDLTDVADAASNRWLTNAPLVLVGKAGMRLAQDLEHDRAYKKFREEFESANGRMIADIALQSTVGRPMSMGEEI